MQSNLFHVIDKRVVDLKLHPSCLADKSFPEIASCVSKIVAEVCMLRSEIAPLVQVVRVKDLATKKGLEMIDLLNMSASLVMRYDHRPMVIILGTNEDLFNHDLNKQIGRIIALDMSLMKIELFYKPKPSEN